MPPNDAQDPVGNDNLSQHQGQEQEIPVSEVPSSRFSGEIVLYSLVGILVLAIVIGAGWFYWQFSGASIAPVAETSQPELTAKDQPRTIGIVYFRQGLAAVDSMKQELARLGYTHITYIEKEVVVGPTMIDDMHTYYQEMFDQGIDMIWADHEHQTKVALEMTKEQGLNIPIVYIARFHDPVEYGLADSFKSSGNNATGVAGNLSEVTQRTLGFLRELRPDIKKIGIFGAGYQVEDIAGRYFQEFKTQANDLGIQIVEYKTDVPPPGAEAAFHEAAAAIQPGDIDAIIHIPGHYYEVQETGEYEEVARRLGIPMSVPYEDLAGGGHFSFSTNYEHAAVQTVPMIEKIFNGTKPADIPIEYGSKNDLALHMGRAKESGITFPNSMLFIANEKRQ